MPSDQTQLSEIPPVRVVLVVIFLTFLTILAAGLLGLILGGRSEVLLSEALVIVPAWIYVQRNGYDWRLAFRVRSIPRQAVFASVLIAVGASFFGHELDVLVQRLFPMPEEIAEGIEQMLRARSFFDGVVVVFAVVGLAGLLEEMVFRGLLLRSLEASFDVTRAVLLSALLFALFHLNPWSAVQILLFGVVLGVTAWRSQSVFPAAIIHAVNNGLEFTVINVGEERLSWMFFGDHISPVLLVLSGLFLYYGFRMLYKPYETVSNAQGHPEGRVR